MRRWITRSAVGFVVLLALALAGMWIRSYWRLNVWSWVRADGSTRAIVSHHGAVHLIAAGTKARERPVTWDTYRIPAGATHASVHTVGDLEWNWLGFARVKSSLAPMVVVQIAPPLPARPPPPVVQPTTTTTMTTAASKNLARSYLAQPLMPLPASVPSWSVLTMPSYGPFGRTLERPLVPWLNAPPSDALIVPYWPLAAAVGGYAAMLVRRRVVAMLRRRRRQCMACGYDLRGSPLSERCPECGTAIG